eukprot:scaffold123379_cov58-Cyclotella_meneghiniana.AAC.3
MAYHYGTGEREAEAGGERGGAGGRRERGVSIQYLLHNHTGYFDTIGAPKGLPSSRFGSPFS